MKQTHFDEIAINYDEQIPKHIREHLCAKKVDFILKNLTIYKSGINYNRLKGLDCGCGTGWHIEKFWEKGFIVDGIDNSKEIIAQAKINNRNTMVHFVVSSVNKIAFKDKTYDFIYFINLLHHLDTLDMQKNAIMEAHRLLKNGGMLFIHEVNEDFLLFKIYMKYIFPFTNKLHRGRRKERYLGIKHILDIVKDNWLLCGIEYFTFLPNITPAFAFPFIKKLEAFLERSTKNKFGAHWIITLEKVQR